MSQHDGLSTVVPTRRADTIRSWRAYMRRRNLSEGTIRARMYVLRAWWDRGDPFTATTTDVELFVDGDRPRAASTRYAVVSHLHAFYSWAMRQRLTDNDPTALVDRPRLEQRLPRPIHATDLALAVMMAPDPIHRAAVLLAAGSGLRCIELARLRWDDVHDGQARLFGKGAKERMVPLHPLALEAMDRIDRTSVYVLDGWQTLGQPSNPGFTASRKLNAYLRSIGVAATAHQLRHYAGTAALEASGGDLRAVQELLGHSSPATTALYTRLDTRRLRDVVQRIALPA